jgi:hypothetical protein
MGSAAVNATRHRRFQRIIAISEPIIAEVIGVLRERFAWDGYRLQAERERIKSITKFVTPSEILDVIDYDSPDNRISGMCRRGRFRVHYQRGQGFTAAQGTRERPHYQSGGNARYCAREALRGDNGR